jgi:hypothetical protein
MAEAGRQFWNPQEVESRSLEAVTRELVKTHLTEKPTRELQYL